MELVMRVRGMSCQHCVTSVKRAIAGIQGVEDVRVDLQKGEAWVLAKEDVSLGELRKAVEDAGYELEDL